MLTIASSLAVLRRLSALLVAKSRSASLYCRTTFAVQNFAMFVSAAVRVVLVADPRSLTSLNAVTHAELESAGGGGGSNALPPRSTYGVIDATHGVCGGRYAGGVSRQTPAAGASTGSGEVAPIGSVSPSPERSNIMCWAAVRPTAMPLVLAEPLAIAA